MLERKSASAEALPPGSSASLVARAMGDATMMSDWNRSAYSLPMSSDHI